jgi:hypothetical protein
MTPEAFDTKLREAKWLWHGMRMKRREALPGQRSWAHNDSSLTVAVTWLGASECWLVTFVVKAAATSMWLGSGPTSGPELGYRQVRKKVGQCRAAIESLEAKLDTSGR